MEFNELQTSLWSEMIKLIELYRKDGKGFSDFVNGLEGLLDAGEFQNKELITKWYSHWTPLEILSATKGDHTKIEDSDKYVSAMEIFLRSNYSDSTESPPRDSSESEKRNSGKRK